VNLGEGSGEAQEPGDCRVDGSRGFMPQAGCSLFVARSGLDDVQVGFRTEAQTHRSQPCMSSWRRDSQGMVALGSVRWASRRRSSSARWASVNARTSGASARLSQRSSASLMRSATDGPRRVPYGSRGGLRRRTAFM
jgi:hypothetical protein